MSRSCVLAICVAALHAFGWSGTARAQERPDLSGRWRLDHRLSEFPREVGFDLDLAPTGSGSGSASGGRSRRGGSTGSAATQLFRRESADDAARLKQLTAEVRTPPDTLVIVQSGSEITIGSPLVAARTFHVDGRETILHLDRDVPVTVVARWEAGRLLVLYRVEEGRELRYTYQVVANPPQLVIDTQFVERGGGDLVRRVYGPAAAAEPEPVDTDAAAAPSPHAPPVPPEAWHPPLARQAGQPGGPAVPPPAGTMPGGSMPASGGPATPFSQQPGAELKGLRSLGVVVEDLGSLAVKCGLNQATLETMASKALGDAGLTVKRNSDEDTYVYVNINTSTLSSGYCISRFDAYLYTHTTAALTYQPTPVLVQVSLMHEGGIAGGAPAAHAEAVSSALKGYIEGFATKIRNANR